MARRGCEESGVQSSYAGRVSKPGHTSTNHILEYIPSRPVSIRLSSWRMKVPGFENKGVKRVTSLRYVQIIPSPRVGSGVEVRQTVSVLVRVVILGVQASRLTLYILKRENTEAVELSPVRGVRSVIAHVYSSSAPI